MILVRYYDTSVSTYLVAQIRPGFGGVDYPGNRLFERKSSRDHAVIVQRPMLDDRPRRWIWTAYRESMPLYRILWDLLSSLEIKNRLEAGYTDPRVQIWEDETASGGFGHTTDGNPPDLVAYTNLRWTWVKFLQVDRTVRDAKSGALLTFDETFVEFVISDPDYKFF